MDEWIIKRMVKLDGMLAQIVRVLDNAKSNDEDLEKIKDILMTDEQVAMLFKETKE